MKKAIALCLVTILNFNNAKALNNNPPGSETSNQITQAPANVSTLEETLVGAYLFNPDIKKARADFEATSEFRSQAFSRFLPTVSASINYGRQKTEIEDTKFNGDVKTRSLDAEQELFEAKSRALRTKRDQVIAYYTLLARIGRLTAKDLSLPVEYYDPEKHYEDVKNKFIGFGN